MEKTVIGLVEKIKVNGKEVLARIDTGAERGSIDARLAAELKLGPIFRVSRIRSAHGHGIRPVIKASVNIGNRTFHASFTVAGREHMKYRVLIGRNILKKGFLIDTTR